MLTISSPLLAGIARNEEPSEAVNLSTPTVSNLSSKYVEQFDSVMFSQ